MLSIRENLPDKTWYIDDLYYPSEKKKNEEAKRNTKTKKEKKNVRYGENNKRSICDPFIMKIKWISKSLTNHDLFYPR